MSREAMQLALGALELYQSRMSVQMFDEAVKALRKALETEPFEYWNAVEGWVKIDEVREHFDAVGCGTIYKSAGEGRSPLYTAPQSNTSEIWARVDKDGNVTHLDMELCAKGPHNAYTALAMAIWKKAIETEREKVAAWMMASGYTTGHGDTIEDLLKEVEWQIREQEREACIDIVAMHGGSVEIEAAIRAKGGK